MQIIPVIDLMQGQVVHAKQGRRDQYMPITSPLCASSEPLAIIASMLELYPFETFYIADIDAIQRQGRHEDILRKITTQYPNITIWLDSGIDSFHYENRHIVPVIGTESLSSMQQYHAISQQAHLLSLDHDANGPMGLHTLHQAPDAWPDNVICMTLNQVGSSAGVDIETLSKIQLKNHNRASPSTIYAAGGVSDKADLEVLKRLDIAGALIATALHQSKISAEDIVRFSK